MAKQLWFMTCIREEEYSETEGCVSRMHHEEYLANVFQSHFTGVHVPSHTSASLIP